MLTREKTIILISSDCWQVFACSLITNMCVVEYNTGIDTNHQEVIEWGRKRAADMKDFIAQMVETITNNP